MGEYKKPLPLPDEDTAPFWQACKEHRLTVQRCTDCGAHRFRPNLVCPECLSEAHEWVNVSGKAKVWSWILVHNPMLPGWEQNEFPYNVACVELEEGPRLTTNIVGCANQEIEIGMPVEVVWEDVTPEVTLFKFQPVRG